MAATKTIATVIATPVYWEDACKHLMKKDRVMKRLIPQFGDACLQTRGDAFVTLARSIVGQQISVKAAQTVWDRFALLPKKITAGNVLKLKVDDMRAAGLSVRKVEYLVDLALHFDSGVVHVKAWEAMDDEAIIAELIAIRGIGRWTAEMFLIFPPDAPQYIAAGRCGPDQRHQPELFFGRCGQPQRRPRSRRCVGALLQRGNLVYLALAGSGTGGILRPCGTDRSDTKCANSVPN